MYGRQNIALVELETYTGCPVTYAIIYSEDIELEKLSLFIKLMLCTTFVVFIININYCLLISNFIRPAFAMKMSKTIE